jgi:hypothetical protein
MNFRTTAINSSLCSLPRYSHPVKTNKYRKPNGAKSDEICSIEDFFSVPNLTGA